MQIKYFSSAWNDIKNSPAWFGKLCLLALVGLIPVFGQIVIFGYLYGWARDIAWGMHEPMPAKIFGNEDGKLYRRGWFILVVAFIFSLVPGIVQGVGEALQAATFSGAAHGSASAGANALSLAGSLVSLVGSLGGLFLIVLGWIGSMRAAIYDKLSCGLQLGKIWKMFRCDTGGIMRIFGMYLLVGLIVGFIVGIIISVFMVAFIFVGTAGVMSAGYTASSFDHMTNAEATRFLAQFIGSAGIVGIVAIIAGIFVAELATAFLGALVARAMGYWTWQFDVPHWAGPNDPLPFEVTRPASGNVPWA